MRRFVRLAGISLASVLCAVFFMGSAAAQSVALSKSFSPSTISPGGTVTLEFTLELGDSPGDATNIAFSDDLNAALSGLAAVGLPANNVCGAGSQLSGTTNLSFTGGSLVAGSSCTFSVTLQVPLTAVAGNYTNTTSNVTATVLGNSVTGNQPASDVLVVAALTFSKSFTNDPVAPGDTVTLQFVINNATSASSAIAFTDDLDATLSGLAAVGPLPTNPCGAGSVLSGTSLLALTGGNLAALASCTFNVTLQVPAGAAGGEYRNTTSTITGIVGGSPVTGNAAVDNLLIVIPAPDLTVAKTNTVGGAAVLGNTWIWRSTINNGGNAPAIFADGQTIYTDTMPSIDVSYGAPSIGSASGITGAINCALSGGNVILCTASGAVSIAVSGSFRVDVTATPTAAGTFTNPTGGLARVNPDNNAAESNEANNDSNSDSVVVTALPDLTVSKTNTVSGATTLGNTWAWRSTISNGGNAPANFAGGQTIYTDTMPSTSVNYGAPSVGSQSGITGTINCALSGANVILCTASGAVVIAAAGSFRVDVTATPSATGTFTNPAGGAARVDPNNNVAESNEANNDSNSDSVVVTAPDLTASKTNSVSGATTLGNTWVWRSTISNGGNAPANFAGGQTIYTDTMPSTSVSYGAPFIGSQSGITGTINCALNGGNVILCTASGAVAIAAPGSFRVDVTATPSASGTFNNPTGGPARVDPNSNVAESNEANNDSNSDNVVVSPIVSFTGPSATGTGTITASFTSGDTGCSYTVSQYIGAPPGVLPVPPTLPAPGTVFPHGLFNFTVAGCTPGATLNFTIVYPQALPPGTQYWKYGPTSTDATPHWYVLPTVISGNTITFSIIDGGLGDDDLVANGTIVDQGGPGASTVPIPALSVWALALLALMLLGFSARRARKKR